MDEDFPVTLQGELLKSKKGKTANWLTSMKPSHMDAFSQDSGPIKEARACYFAMHPWDWAHSNMEDLSDIFKGLAQKAGLLGESIFKIQWSWEGPEHLKHANYVLQSLPKESLKVMGLKGIHDPEALWHFTSHKYCLWCGKDRQNEGTVMNHLRMVHYKLGLVCNICFSWPMTMSDTLHRHGHLTCMN